MPHNLVRLMLVLLLLGSQAVLHADTSNDWLRGTSNHLEMRLQGEVLNVEGRPAIGADVDARIFARAGEHLQTLAS